MFGHTWINPAVFNDLKVLQVGDEILLTTQRGVLRYVVELSYTVAKPELTTDSRYAEAVAGRLVLVACYRETGDERVTQDNLVVQAQLQPYQS